MIPHLHTAACTDRSQYIGTALNVGCPMQRGSVTAKPWVLRMICCGRDDGTWPCATWDEADALRMSYIAVEGHERTAIIEAVDGS